MPPCIAVRGLTKHYGEVQAVRGIDFSVEQGEVFGLLGPNGAGKTTTVEILEGLRERTSGQVLVLGMDPAHEVNRLKDRIGVCLQATNLQEKLTLQEAVRLFASFYSRKVDETKLLDRLQLSEKKNAFYGTLSGGQKQRLALALAMINDPDLLFLDEPTAGLDPQVRLGIHDLILELRDKQRSIVLTTHYIEEAERLCDRVAIIDQGQIVVHGTPRQLVEETFGSSLIELEFETAVPVGAEPPVHEGDHISWLEGRRHITVKATKPAKAIVELVKWSDTAGFGLADIGMKRPTLEDVFLHHTGKRLRE